MIFAARASRGNMVAVCVGALIGSGTCVLLLGGGEPAQGLPAPNNVSAESSVYDAIQSEVGELRRQLEKLEAMDRTVEMQGQAAGAGSEMPKNLEIRVAALEEALKMLKANAHGSEPEAEAIVEQADQRALARLAGQVFDQSLGLRVRLESLQVLGKVDSRLQPFGSVDLVQLSAFLGGVANPAWRRKGWRYVRGHVDRSWLPVLTDAVRKEAEDEVRAEIIEVLAILKADPEVQAFLASMGRLPDLGPKSKDAIQDILK